MNPFQDLFDRQKRHFATGRKRLEDLLLAGGLEILRDRHLQRGFVLRHEATHAKSMLVSPPDVVIDHLFPPEKNTALTQWFEY